MNDIFVLDNSTDLSVESVSHDFSIFVDDSDLIIYQNSDDLFTVYQ